MELDKMRQDMLQKDIEIDSLRKKLNKVLQQRKQLSVVCVSVCVMLCVFAECVVTSEWGSV